MDDTDKYHMLMEEAQSAFCRGDTVITNRITSQAVRMCVVRMNRGGPDEAAWRWRHWWAVWCSVHAAGLAARHR